MSQKSILLILSQAPYGTPNAREALDIALTSAAFDQTVSILFSGDGTWLLQAEQNPADIEQKSVAQVCAALPMYDIDQLFVVTDDAEQRGVKYQQSPASPLGSDALSAFIAKHDVVLRF